MRSTKKSKPHSQISSRSISYEDAERELLDALKAEPKDIKVPISLRLDGDVYLELKRLAEKGTNNGKYQTTLNQILRHYLFHEAPPKAVPTRKKAAGD